MPQPWAGPQVAAIPTMLSQPTKHQIYDTISTSHTNDPTDYEVAYTLKNCHEYDPASPTLHKMVMNECLRKFPYAATQMHC